MAELTTYDYVAAEGNLLYQVVRKTGKRFLQRRPDSERGWIWNRGEIEPVLYNLPQVLTAVDRDEVVFVVEGEKDADSISQLGLTATTNPGGPCRWKKVYSESLEGARVVIIPDNDFEGEAHASSVGEALTGLASEIRLLRLKGLQEGADISDWIGQQRDLSDNDVRDELERLVAELPPWEPPPVREPAAEIAGLAPTEAPYTSTPHGLYFLKETKDGTIPVALTNFTARIAADIRYDDGVETRRSLEIEANLGGDLSRFLVPEPRFLGMGWVLEHLGAKAVVHAGHGTKDRTRAAIQLLSEDITSRTIFTHLGWREINGHDCYLHSGGAIGPRGAVRGVEVETPGDLALFRLPAPPTTPEEVEEAVHSSLEMIEVAPKTVTVPVFSAIWRAAQGPCDFALHLAGRTGTGKSELAALAQQHYGEGLDARHLPGSWSSTANALEVLAFSAKDSLLVVDDFAPEGTRFDVQRMHKDAARLLRAQGNRSGRQRLRPDASLRATKYPRGLILSTGEDVPSAHSIRARMFVVDVSQAQMEWRRLTECQQSAASGTYALTFAAYVQWLAGNRKRVSQLRGERLQACRGGQLDESHRHRRTGMIEMELSLGLEVFLTFAREVGALDLTQVEELRAAGLAALRQVADAQAEHLVAVDPALRFLELIRSALVSGAAHLASKDGGEPDSASTWGWRKKKALMGPSEWHPRGKQIGWVNGDHIYLDPDSAFQVAQSSGEGLVATPQTLWKRMRESGYLASHDETRQRNTVRKTLDQSRRTVLHIHARSLHGTEPAQTSHSAQCVGTATDSGTVSRDGSFPSGSKPSRETVPSKSRIPRLAAAAGTVGTVGTVPAGTDTSLGSSQTDDEEVVL